MTQFEIMAKAIGLIARRQLVPYRRKAPAGALWASKPPTTGAREEARRARQRARKA